MSNNVLNTNEFSAEINNEGCIVVSPVADVTSLGTTALVIYASDSLYYVASDNDEDFVLPKTYTLIILSIFILLSLVNIFSFWSIAIAWLIVLTVIFELYPSILLLSIQPNSNNDFNIKISSHLTIGNNSEILSISSFSSFVNIGILSSFIFLRNE